MQNAFFAPPPFRLDSYLCPLAKGSHLLPPPSLLPRGKLTYVRPGRLRAAVSQTRTILRYLASTRPEHGLMGKDFKEQMRADLLAEVCQELMDQFCRMTYSAWIDFPSRRSHFLASVLPAYLGRFERGIRSNLPKEWCAGASLTYADFLLYEAFFQVALPSPFGPPKSPLRHAASGPRGHTNTVTGINVGTHT